MGSWGSVNEQGASGTPDVKKWFGAAKNVVGRRCIGRGMGTAVLFAVV
jgi:hypothetical protein